MTEEALGSLHRGLCADGAVRFMAVEAKKLCQRIQEQHELNPGGVRVAGEAMLSALFMSAYIKGEERITLQLQGEHPHCAFIADVDVEGGARARFTPPKILYKSGAPVDGMMLAIKSDARTELYRGITRIEHSTIEVALGDHLRNSAQVDVLLRLRVDVDREGRVKFAGGLLLERLPESKDHPSMTSSEFEQHFSMLSSQPVEDIMVGLAFGKLGQQSVELLENRNIHWRCSCGQERVEALLYQMGPGELQTMKDEDGGAEVTCHFCNIRYQVDEDRLMELIEMHQSADRPK